MILLFFAIAVFALAWVGHACIWTAILNYIYGCPVPKQILKPWRYATALIILTFPILLWSAKNPYYFDYPSGDDLLNGAWGRCVLAYVVVCFIFGGVILPAITVARFFRDPPKCVDLQTTRTFDLWPELGEKLIGDGRMAFAARVPGNGVFRVDITDLTLALPSLPPEWDGLTLLVLNDLHFHGTPSRVYFERVLDELASGPRLDVVCLIGDYIDTDTHHEWIQPLLGKLVATEAKFAILGNHDRHHDPDRVRKELAATGYTVLGNAWRELTIRGARCIVVGHEGPWYAPPPDLSSAPPELFRLCLSHTPDNFYWGIANRVGLMLSGHVHGGAIRIPVIGSIFVPSIYGRRFDYGVFEEGGTVMAVNRGLSGREPIRFRCNPQVMRVTLRVRRPR